MVWKDHNNHAQIFGKMHIQKIVFFLYNMKTMGPNFFSPKKSLQRSISTSYSMAST